LADKLIKKKNQANFTWSNVMGFDLYRMFTNIMGSSANSEDKDSRDKRFRQYSMYAWFVPLLFVLAPIGKQFTSMEISYGLGRCFLSTQIDVLVFFVLPIAVVLLVNLAFLIFTILSILKVDKMSNKVLKIKKSELEMDEPADEGKKTNLKEKFNRKIHRINDSFKSEKKRFFLFIKLFLLTGMTWFFGLAAANDHDSAFWYVYIGLNSLQGLFIFFSFAFNSQTRRELGKNKTLRALSDFVSKSSRVDSLTQSSTARSSNEPDSKSEKKY